MVPQILLPGGQLRVHHKTSLAVLSKPYAFVEMGLVCVGGCKTGAAVGVEKQHVPPFQRGSQGLQRRQLRAQLGEVVVDAGLQIHQKLGCEIVVLAECPHGGDVVGALDCEASGYRGGGCETLSGVNERIGLRGQ